MADPTVNDLADAIATLIEQRLHVRGRGLAVKLKRAGRLLPRHIRRDAGAIAAALPLEGHPKLARQVDLPRLEAAERRVVAWLKTVDPNKRRIDMLLSMLGGIAFGVIVAIGALVMVLVWRGLI